MTRVLLVDDHPMIGAALEMLLRESSYELLGRARTAAEASKRISAEKPDLLLLDVHLPDSSGLDLLRRLARARTKPDVILLTAGMDEAQLLAADDLEPQGMVLKTSDPGLLIDCMDAVVTGKRRIDPEITERAKSVTGFNVGVDATYIVWSNDSVRIGAGGFVRFTQASADIQMFDAGSSQSTDVGGIQFGFGGRIRF